MQNTSTHKNQYVGIVLADERMRITHTNSVFTQITGYAVDEVIGKSCNFLQGPNTNSDTVNEIRAALRNCEPCQVALLNYRKDGEPFWNVLSIYPLFSKSGEIDSYIGIQMVQQSQYIDESLGILPWASHRKEQLTPSKKRDDVQFIAETNLPTKHGVFVVRAFKSIDNDQEIMCICSNNGIESKMVDVNVRVHDQCFTSEVLGSLKCDCKEQLEYAMMYIKKHDGMIIYMPQEGRGMGLSAKIKAYSVQEHGYDTVDANAVLGYNDDTRDYSCVPSILSYCNVKSIALLTNNPFKIKQLTDLGVDITRRIPIEIASNPHSKDYLKAKQTRMGHLFNY